MSPGSVPDGTWKAAGGIQPRGSLSLRSDMQNEFPDPGLHVPQAQLSWAVEE